MQFQIEGVFSLRGISIMTGMPLGLCANREDHTRHVHDSETLGRFICTADQAEREPYRSERRRQESNRG